MEEEILKILTIILLTMLKFIAGPTLGFAGGFSFIVTVLMTIAGMMGSVFIFTFLGKVLREKILSKLFRKRKKFTRRSRRFVIVWKKYGITGVAFLTPIIFTPIGGTILLTSMGTPKRKVVFVMLFSAVFWALVFSSLIYAFGPRILPDFIR